MNHQLTRKDLVRRTGAKPYVVQYLTETGKLPLTHESRGKGDYHIYHADAIRILIEWLERSAR